MKAIRFKSAGLTTVGQVQYQGVPINVVYTLPPAIGYMCYLDGMGDTYIEDGDFILVDNQTNIIVSIVTNSEYTTKPLLKVEIDQMFAEGIIREIVANHAPANNGQEIAFNNQMTNAKNYAQFGKLNKLKDEISSINDTSVISSSKKTEIISKIDAHAS